MTKEELIKYITEDYLEYVYLAAESPDTDEDYEYIEGVNDGSMRSLRKVLALVNQLPDDPVPSKEITLRDLYRINGYWDYKSLLTVIIYDEAGCFHMEAAQAISCFGDRVVKMFEGNTITLFKN